MEQIEAFFDKHNLQDVEDLDSLLALASLMRDAIDAKQYADIIRMVQCTVERDCLEAFFWCIEILQEEMEKEDCQLDDFVCMLGKSISNYDALIERLRVDFRTAKNGLEKILDSHGEVESFFNILIYQTGYPNIRFISTENFDTKDNDYIQYKLSFIKE